jgi:hypothetical protein
MITREEEQSGPPTVTNLVNVLTELVALKEPIEDAGENYPHERILIRAILLILLETFPDVLFGNGRVG